MAHNLKSMSAPNLSPDSEFDPHRALAMLDISDVHGPMALCSEDGTLLALNELSRELFATRGADVDVPTKLPVDLLRALEFAPVGEAVDWHVPDCDDLGVTRYAMRGGLFVLLMKELGARDRPLAIRLHRQRLQTTGRMVASVAHDLRTAIASVFLETDALLATGRADRSTTSSLLRIRNGCERLRATVDGLLDFAKADHVGRPPTLLSVVIERVADLVGPMLRERDLRMHVSVPDDFSFIIKRPLVVEQIMMNLLVNAVEASHGGGEIVVEARPSQLPTKRGPVVDIAVQDDGPGIAPEVRQRIFEAFFTTKRDGTGLGLAASLAAARELDGDLRLVASDAGARFVLSVPVVPQQTLRSRTRAG
mgnify:CR=1 FL=1